MGQEQPWDRQTVHDELDWVQADFRQLLGQATQADLAQRTDGTRWTNEQLLSLPDRGLLRGRPRRRTGWTDPRLEGNPRSPPIQPRRVATRHARSAPRTRR
jgi:hypothetical protein